MNSIKTDYMNSKSIKTDSMNSNYINENDFCDLITHINAISSKYKDGKTIEDRIFFGLCVKVVFQLETILYNEANIHGYNAFDDSTIGYGNKVTTMRLNEILNNELDDMTVENKKLKEQIDILTEYISYNCNIPIESISGKDANARTLNNKTSLLNENFQKEYKENIDLCCCIII